MIPVDQCLYEMVTRLFLLQSYIFSYNFVKLRAKIFIVAIATPQIFLLAFLVSLKNVRFRNEKVL